MENLAPFFDDDEFPVGAVLADDPVRGFFDSAYVSAGAGLGMSCSAPAFTLPTASVQADPVGSVLLVAGVSYTVAQHQPDGTGVSVLILELTV